MITVIDKLPVTAKRAVSPSSSGTEKRHPRSVQGSLVNMMMSSNLAGIGNVMLKERRWIDRLFFNMELVTLVRWRLYIEAG